jgi:hypothetical protein
MADDRNAPSIIIVIMHVNRRFATEHLLDVDRQIIDETATTFIQHFRSVVHQLDGRSTTTPASSVGRRMQEHLGGRHPLDLHPETTKKNDEQTQAAQTSQKEPHEKQKVTRK